MAFSENLSMTIGDLSVDTGLLDMTCSGLLSSPDNTCNRDHDVSICSCHGEKNEVTDLDDEVEMSRAGEKETTEETQGETDRTKTGLRNPDEVQSPVAGNVLPQSEDEAGIAESEPPQESLSMMKPPSGNMSLFNDTSFNISKALSRVDKNETFGGYNFSYTDSTKFYSLVQNLDDFMGKDEDEDNLDNGHDSSFNSMGDVEINDEHVTFRNNSVLTKNQRNEFLLNNGDLNVDSVHQNALAIEETFLTREKITKDLAEALEACLKSNEEKDREIEILKSQVEEQQQLLALKEDEKKENSSPIPETFSSESEPLNSEIEDLKLQVTDLEKKLDIERKYLGTQTAERELEQDDYQRQISAFMTRNEELLKDKSRLEILVSNQKTEIEDFEMKMKEAIDAQEEARSRSDRVEDELKSAVEKIHELRHIIGDLEKQIDETTSNVRELKDQNLALQDNLERIEKIREQEEQEPPHEDTVVTVNTDLTEELHAQVEDLAQRLQRKLNDMDNFQWSTRPNSSCSNAVSVSNEDISVSRDLGYINKDHEYASQDLAVIIMDGFRKLDGQFESLVRFEEIIMKKLKDAEIRLIHAKKAQEDFESEKQILLDKLRSQTMKISDLENCLDQSRYEPNPNAVTLSGLRARVTALKGELEETQGKLNLKDLELQDVLEKLSAKDALLTKLSNSPQHVYHPPTIKKSNVSAQTERRKIQSISTQTDQQEIFKVPKTKSASDAAVQTQPDSLELSTIQGVTPVTHSTPNEGSGTLMKSAMRNLRNKKSSQSDTLFTNQISEQEHSPEVLRDPARSRIHVSFRDDIPRLPDLKQLEEAGETGQKGGTDDDDDDSSYLKSGGGGSGYDGDRSGSRGPTTNRNAAGTGSGGTNKDSQTPPLGLSNLVDALDPDEKKKLFQELLKAENLSPVIDSKNKEIQDLMDRIKQLESGDGVPRSRPSSRNRDGAGTAGSCVIETTLNFDDTMKPTTADTRMNYVVNPKALSGGKSSEEGGSTGSGGRLSNGSKLSLTPEQLEEAKAIYDAIGCDLNAMAGLTVVQYQTVLQVLTAVVQAEFDPDFDPNSTASDTGLQGIRMHESRREETFTYELETVCDFQVGNDGDLTLVNAQGRVIPSESHARILSGSHPFDNGGSVGWVVDRSSQSAPNQNSSGRSALQGMFDLGSGGDECGEMLEPPAPNSVDWERLQKDKDRRLNEADALLELNTLKTNMEMLRQAFEKEKAKNKIYEDRMTECNDVSRQLCQQEGRAQELQSIIDQQQQQINQLVQQLQESGQSVPTPSFALPDSTRANANCNVDRFPPLQTENLPSLGLISFSRKEIVAGQTQKWFELYLRAKSYRKALAWQKKYLAIVIQGYKDLLGVSGAAFQHPDLLQRQVPITPSSVGLCDRKKGKTRFRIIGKVVIAAIRMKYMVNRWGSKITVRNIPDSGKRVPYTQPESSRYGSPSSSTAASSESDSSSGHDYGDRGGSGVIKGSTGIASSALSPPTKDEGKVRMVPRKPVRNVQMPKSATSQQRPSTSTDQRFSKSQPSVRSSSNINNATNSGRGVQVGASQISQYFERFQHLENEIGSTISRGGSFVTQRERTESDK